MVVGNLNVMGVAVAPAKADAPLVVDADAVLTFAIPDKFFQSIAWRHTEVLQRFRRIKESELSQGCSLQLGSESLDLFTQKELLSILVSETSDHARIVSPRAIYRQAPWR